jgi:hypothetical protein
LYWATVPDLDLGTNFPAAITQVSATRWERVSDLAVLWLEAVDSPVSRDAGHYRNYWENPDKTIDESGFDADRVTVTWETSSDRETEIAWTGNNARRFVRSRVATENL